MTLQHAHLSVPKPGERANGDAVLVREDGPGRVMLAVVDGIGHGPTAAEAATTAVARLRTLSWEMTMLDIMQTLHKELRGTRGAAATVCVLNRRKLEACAVGNVQLSSFGCHLPLVLSAGVLGHQVGTFRVCRGEVPARTRLALFSDGISTRVRLEDTAKLTPAAACHAIFGRFRQTEDDATILVADVAELQ
jgi:negative regulator of sigma-B (phosphoserine phosphatase)